MIQKALKAANKVKTEKTTARKSSKARKTSNNVPSKKKVTETKPKRPKREAPDYAAIGAEGEQQIYEWLVRMFGVNYVFRNVYVMRSSGRLTEIDLLAIHPTGVFVVESKNYSGMVSGDGQANEWLHLKTNNYQRSFYSPVAQNAGHIDALREACQYHLGFVPPMLSLLVFPDKCELQITNLPPGLRCCRLSQMPSILNMVFNTVTPVLGVSHLEALAPLFYQSQRCVLPPSVQAQHMRDVSAAKRWAYK